MIRTGSALMALFLVGGMLMITIPAAAQEEAPTDERGGAGYFSTGISYLTNLGDINDALDAFGYPESNRLGIAIGGGGYGVTRAGWMLGGEGFGVIVPNERTNARDANYAAGMGFFNVGYQAWNRDGRWIAYPFLGVGGGGSTLAFEQTGAETFDDVLANPNRGATLVQASLLLQIGVGIEVRGGRAAARGGPFVGLRAGFVVAPVSGDWAFDEGDDLRGGPSASPSGPYLRIVVGGGGPQRPGR